MMRRSQRNRAGTWGVGVALATFAAAVLGSAGTASAQLPTNNWLDYNLIAQTRLGIGPGMNLDGNYAVIEPGGLLTVAGQSFQLDHNPPFFLVADQVSLNNSSSVVDVYTNDLSGGGFAFEIRGTLTQPFPFFPLNIAIPPLPPGSFDPCTGLGGDLTVGNGGTASFNPGCYRDLKIGNDAVVTLKPGTFIFRNCTTGDRSVVIGQGHVDLICQNMLDTMVGTVMAPMNANQPPTDLQIWIAGASGSRIGIDTILKGTLVAPNDDGLRIGQGVTFIGTAFAGGIELRGFHGPHPATPTPLTPTPTPTKTPSTPTPTPTGGITPPPNTPTPGGPTPTPTRTPGPTPTLPPGVTPTPTPQPTPTLPIVVPTPTPTRTPRPTPTLPPGVTPTPTPKPTPTLPPGVTPTPTRTPAPTPTLPPGVTPTPTPQFTPTPFPTVTSPVNPPTPPGFRKKPWGRGKFNPGYWPSMGPRQNSRAPAMKKFIPRMKMK